MVQRDKAHKMMRLRIFGRNVIYCQQTEGFIYA